MCERPATFSGVAIEPDTCDLLCLDLPKAEALRASQPGVERLDDLARVAKAFGDPTRLAIAIALRDGDQACVCDLGWVLGRDEKLVSHHLRQLRGAGLARSRRDGKMVMYELTERARLLLDALAADTAGKT
ncbi:MAG: winged helix-turn-helix transcriptional regulator [Actinobacteria bacterium]|nr:MAG: winged helix-turn-helix transcriptional regulator [Actinomycetota bacterium]